MVIAEFSLRCSRSSHIRLATALLCWIAATGAYAQAPSASAPQARTQQSSFKGFDVISVKQNKREDSGMSISNARGTFSVTNTTLTVLLMNAYDVRDTCVFGVPPWAGKLRWDVTAKVLDPPAANKDHPPSQQQENSDYEAEVQSILFERFGLKAHIEEKLLPVFEMVAVKGGVKFHKSTAPAEKHGWLQKFDEVTATGISLSSFAEIITYDVGRTVIDKTGLLGDYDLSLKWSPEEQVENAEDSGAVDRPEIITAMREQLGLKLVSAKEPVKTLVVDSVNMPTAN